MNNNSNLDFQTKCVHSGIDEYEYGQSFRQSIKHQHLNLNLDMVHHFLPVKKKDTFTQEC